MKFLTAVIQKVGKAICQEELLQIPRIPSARRIGNTSVSVSVLYLFPEKNYC